MWNPQFAEGVKEGTPVGPRHWVASMRVDKELSLVLPPNTSRVYFEAISTDPSVEAYVDGAGYDETGKELVSDEGYCFFDQHNGYMMYPGIPGGAPFNLTKLVVMTNAPIYLGNLMIFTKPN